MLTTYLKLIQEQRLENPNNQKDYRLLELPRLLSTSSEEIKKLKARPNVVFTNIIKRNTPRYKDTEDVYYYEFVDLGLQSRTSFPDWEFWYVPVSKYSELVNEVGDSILPSYQTYNVQTKEIETIKTLTQPLISYPRPSVTFYTRSFFNNTHPLLNHFIFTGHSFLDKKGYMIYEYQDYKMFSDDISITYYSILRPLNFFIKSNLVKEYGIETTTQLLKFIGKPPNYLELYTGVPDLRATGRSTTRDFSNIRRWYEYIRYIDDQPFDKILLPYAPTSLSTDFVKIELNKSAMSLVFNLTNNIQALSINQTSSNNKISIQ